MERNEPPRWMQDKHFNEVLFCEDFLSAHPMVCVDGSFFTVEGRVTDEEGIRKQIYEMLRPHFTSGTARRASTLPETLRLEARRAVPLFHLYDSDLTGTQKLLMTLLLVERYDIYELSCLARMRPEDVTADLAELKRKGYLQGR